MKNADEAKELARVEVRFMTSMGLVTMQTRLMSNRRSQRRTMVAGKDWMDWVDDGPAMTNEIMVRLWLANETALGAEVV